MAANRTVRVAIGDPQAPLSRFLEILDHHDLRGPMGRLRSNVQLVSMGDHFDWGGPSQRQAAAASGMQLMSWLSSHPSDQVVIILGNHDLGRLGEMAGFDDASFAATRAEADRIYGTAEADPAAEKAFLERHPEVPTAECVARDFSTFRVEQRSLLEKLIAERKVLVAQAVDTDFLLCHAGVTVDELTALSVDPGADAPTIATALNGAFFDAFDHWDRRSPLTIPALHQPGDAHSGEARGMFFHRPSNPAHEPAALFAGPPRRRFDPRRLPVGLSQAIGHIRDNKCRRLLQGWHDGGAADDGPLRLLETDGVQVHYRRGTATSNGRMARIYFTDGGMLNAAPSRYELLDLDHRAALEIGWSS